MKAQQQQKGSLINMAAFLPTSCSNGPGRRAVLWVQGCARRCPGCFNQDMQEFREKQMLSVEDMVTRILANKEIEGVTFSGGEPFFQADALAELAERLTAKGMNIVIFTGYTYEEITSAIEPAWQRLLAATDLLIAGPYKQELPSRNYLLGSANQQLVFLTDKLKNHPDIVGDQGQTMEVLIDAVGRIVVTGVISEESE